MAHSESVEAVVLKTYDVGEADRFCIVLTKERGRIAARARGVRKLTSKMGGSLLPLHHVHGLINVVGSALRSGATLEVLPKFDAEAVWARLATLWR